MYPAVRNNFYLLIALFAATMMVIGFSRGYFLRAFFDRPPLTLLLHLHAAAFTAWFVLLLVQIRLVAAKRIAWHRRLGVAGAAVAVLMVVTTLGCIVEAIRGGGVIAGVPAWQFVALSTVSIGLFAGFVAAAVFLRRRPDWHGRFMIVASCGILGPAVGRALIMIGGPPAAIYANHVLGLLLATCIAHDWFRRRIVHPAFVIGAVVMMAAIPLKRVLAHSQAWADFARWIMAG
jgi:hypothetical protein